MRCSICDKKHTVFIYGNWHCGECSDVIRQTIGNIREEDIIDIFEDDDLPLISSYSLINVEED